MSHKQGGEPNRKFLAPVGHICNAQGHETKKNKQNGKVLAPGPIVVCQGRPHNLFYLPLHRSGVIKAVHFSQHGVHAPVLHELCDVCVCLCVCVCVCTRACAQNYILCHWTYIPNMGRGRDTFHGSCFEVPRHHIWLLLY